MNANLWSRLKPSTPAALAAPPAPSALMSEQWFRVAALRPLLNARITSQRHVQRGQVWHVLTLPDGTRSFRLNTAAWHTVARCDGQRTTQRLWDIALAEFGDLAPTQGEVLSILARLHAAGLISFDSRPDFGAASLGADATQADGSHQQPRSLLSWRVPLGNPDALLGRLARRWPAIPGALLLSFWFLAVAWAVLAGAAHSGELAAQLSVLLASPSAWGLAWLAYPLLKVLHEGAHGLLARSLGARVPQWGVTLMMLVPVPYVDASAASALPQRRQRLLVASAGMLAESLVAAAALALWLLVQPGALRDAALLVFFMAGLSTVLVNANPLLRFDGYHMLCDALNLPNLATRSQQFVLQVAERLVLRQNTAAGVVPAAGERSWLLVYAPAAWVMRCLIAWAVILWLGGVSQWLGLFAAALFVWSMVLVPAYQLWRWVRRGGLHASSGMPRGLQHALLALPGVLLVALLLWPLPVSTVAQGVLWLPEHALVRSQATGVIGAVHVADGQHVRQGDAVLQLMSPALQADVERLRGRAQDLLAQQERSLQAEPALAVQAEHQLQATLAELTQSEQRLERLTVRAQATGRIVIAHASDLPGRHVQRGVLLAHVITGEPGIVRLAVPHDSASPLPMQQRVQVQSSDPAQAPRWAEWAGKSSGGVTQLPSAALGTRSGGRIATDMTDREGLRPAQPVLVAELQLEGTAAHRLGERVLVRFEQGRAPLLVQLASAVQQQLLRHFNPNT
jgi:putative peptide zinc metalloprotease protein